MFNGNKIALLHQAAVLFLWDLVRLLILFYQIIVQM